MSARTRANPRPALFVLLILVAVVLAWVAVRLLGSSPPEQPVAAPEPLEPEPVTPTLDFTGFDPGNIISDDVFYHSEAMNQEQVAAFIAEVNHGCRTGEAPCLADYREDSLTFPANDYCFEFTGQSNDSAAAIIDRAAKSCGVNPQVLLVMLQKEQGLLTASSYNLTPGRYDIAMGYGCPDTANCDPQFFGFSNQVYHAALQLRRYANEPGLYSFQPQMDNSISYHPDPACGEGTVWIENYATAGLYNYTPYQPDEAALAGTPGPCSSVGNLNFYAYFRAWFG